MTDNIVGKIKSRECAQKITGILEYIHSLELRNENLSKKYQDYNKDRDIQKLQNEIIDIRKRAFWIRTDEDMQQLDNILTEHAKQCRSHNYYYELYPTGMGTVAYVKCKSCGYEKCIADI